MFTASLSYALSHCDECTHSVEIKLAYSATTAGLKSFDPSMPPLNETTREPIRKFAILLNAGGSPIVASQPT